MTGSEPSLEQVLRAIAAEADLERPAKTLGVSRERLVELVSEAADAVRWRIPAKAAQTALALESAPAPKRELARPTQAASAGAHAKLVLYSDGAARGNPGPAGAGAVLKSPDGHIVARLGRFLGRQTNNVAEYEGVLIGLEHALEMGAREIVVRADSLLAISQLKGEWKIKNAGLIPLHARAKELLGRFERVTLQHVPREQNTDADEMSNRAIDERM